MSAHSYRGYIGDRNSSRVLAAPGGNSSLNLFGGGGDAPQALQPTRPAPVQENPQMSHAPKMVAGQMHYAPGRTTEAQGIGARASTRVHAQPGGNSSLNLFDGGYDAPAARQATHPMPQRTAEVAGQPNSCTGRTTEAQGIGERASTRVHAQPGGNSTLNIFGGATVAAPQSQASCPVAPQTRNLPARTTEAMGIGERSSTRVHAQPGGNSTLNIFGGGESAAPMRQQAKPTIQPSGQAAAGERVIQRSEFSGIGERNSSRVLAAPGGNSSLGVSAADRMATLKARREGGMPEPMHNVTNVFNQ